MIMGRRKTEETFEHRIERHLKKYGFLMINCARSKPFDLIAIKRNFAIPIEIKSRTGRYDYPQKRYHNALGMRHMTNYFVISQTDEFRKAGFEIDVVEMALHNRLRLYYLLGKELLDALRDLGVRDYTYVSGEVGEKVKKKYV